MMNIQDVENLSAGELKEQRAEAVAVARGASDVAERFVSARIDAKLRDEKLAEQGKTIALLQEAGEASKAMIAELEKRLYLMAQQCGVNSEAAGAAEKQLADEKARCARLEKMARVHAAAITEAARVLNQSIANSQVDAANEG